MANTHYVHVVGDAHGHGKPIGHVDPQKGGYLRVFLTGGTIVVNSILRGQTSGAVARVTRLVGPDAFFLELVGSSLGAPPGQPGAAFAGGSTPFVGETILFDNGASAIASPIMSDQNWPQAGQYATIQGDATLNSFTPDDASLDTVFWDENAKIASNIIVPIATVVPAAPAYAFVVGDRVTTSSGGSFTIQLVTVVGVYYHFKAIRKVGSILPGDVLTNTTVPRAGSVCSIWNDPSAVEADQPKGCFVAHHIMPNIAGYGTFYELLPWGDGGGIGVYQPIVRGLYAKWKDDVDSANRGVRVMPFRTFDYFADSARALRGGVALQGVECTGTFPATWTKGETVTGPGGWSAKVWSYDTPAKVVWVYDPNGATLGSGTITAATSGASATCTGPAIGWRKGSTHWNNWMAQYARAQTSTNPLSPGLYGGAPALTEGVFFTIWETEIAPFSTAYHTDKAGIDVLMAAEWTRFIAEVRAEFGDPNLPIVLFQNVIQSHWDDSNIVPGLPISYFVRNAMASVAAALPYVNLATTEGMEGSQITPLPLAANTLYLRPDDYYEVGRRAWRALTYGSVHIPTGNFEPLPIILVAGQSFAKSSIPSGWAFQDNDPELYPALQFPRGSTINDYGLNYDWGAKEWRGYDVEFCANTFLDRTGFGFEAPIMGRGRNRWSAALGIDGPVGLIKFAANGASVVGDSPRAPFTFDPLASSRTTITAVANLTLVTGRCRLTGAPGAFSAARLDEFTTLSGSLLGPQAGGGNNHAQWAGGFCRAIAPDKSYVEIEGGFVPEAGTGTGYLVNHGGGYAAGSSVIAVDTGTGTILVGDRVTFQGHATVYTVTSALSGGNITISPALTAIVADNGGVSVATRTWTLTQGPWRLADEIETHGRIALEKCVTQLRRIPKLRGIIWWNGEADLERVGAYREALKRLIDWFEGIFGLKLVDEARTPVVIMGMSPNTPWDVPDEDIATQIASQQAVAAEVGGVFVSTADVPHNFDSGVFPRLSRRDNGVHATYQGYMWAGRKADYGLYLAGAVPVYPGGEDAAVAAAFGGSASGTGATGGDAQLRSAETTTTTEDPGVAPRSIGTPAPLFIPVVVEDGSGLANADSYLSIYEWRQRVEQIGNPTELSGATDEQVQYWLRLSASHGIDLMFSRVWTGLRANEGQGLDWPRVGAGDNRFQRVIAQTVVPDGVKWTQFWYSIALALGIDPLRDYDPQDDDQRGLFVTSLSEALPGGLSESRTFVKGMPRRAVLLRMCAAAAPFLIEADDMAGMA